jgi:hypothetical protein
MTGRLARLFAAAALALTVAGCANDAPGDLTAAAAKVLAPQVQHVREVAALGDYAQLRAAVANLKSLVRDQQRDGAVSPSRATAIQDAADALLQDARLELSPTPTPTTESPTPTPTTESPTPTPTTTTESPTPTPSDTSSPIVSASVGGGHTSAPPSKPAGKPTNPFSETGAASPG